MAESPNLANIVVGVERPTPVQPAMSWEVLITEPQIVIWDLGKAT